MLAALVLAACGGGSTGEPAPAVPPVPVPVPAPVVTPPLLVLPARVGLSQGGQATLLAVRASGPVDWSSSNAAVASVDSTGLVTALAKGSAVITATAGLQTSSAAVKVHGSADASAAALIDAALAQNRITAEQALIYRVFAKFGDVRLPAEYDGAPQAAPNHFLMREVSGRLDSLTQAGQDTQLPFLLPPIYAQSWHAHQMGLGVGLGLGQADSTRARALSAAGLARPMFVNINCARTAQPENWQRRSTAHFNIYYLKHDSSSDQRAENISQAVAAVIEEVYASLTGVLQRFPISDANLACNGGDGAYDIYLLGWSQTGVAAEVTTYPGQCENSASYMSVNTLHNSLNGAAQQPANAVSLRKVKSLMAHEFMHTLQFTIDRSAVCDEYIWIDEATAQWATDHVDPDYDQEDGFDKLSSTATRTGSHLLRYLGSDHMGSMEQPSRDQSAQDRGYAGYLFFQYLARKYTAGTLKRVMDAQTANASVEAVSAAVAAQGGMKAVWPDFAQTLWLGRAERVLDYWGSVDRYDYGLANIYAPAAGDNFAQERTRLKTLAIDQQGQRRATFKLFENAQNFASGYYEIDPRSLYYEHLKFSDPTVHSVLLMNPIAVLPNREFMKLQAVKKIGGVWQAVEDWTGDSTKSYCLDKKDERLEELILIVSNSEVNRGAEQPFRIPQMFPMRLSTSNVGCWRWEGTASTTTTYDDGNGISGEIRGSGVVRWEVSDVLAGSLYFEPRAGFMDGSANGRMTDCTFTETAERKTVAAGELPDGKMYINLDLELGLGEAPNRELTAFDGAATLQATRTVTCPKVTVSSTGPSSYTWLQVDSETTYKVSADGQSIAGEYIAASAATRSSITTRFKFTAQRE